MSAVVEARHLISEVAGPMQAGAQIQEMLAHVARKTGLGARRIRGIWNNEARAIRAEELDALRTAAKSRQEEQEAADRNEFRILAERIAVLEKRLAEMDQVVAGAALAAGRQATSRMGRLDRAMARPRPR